MIKVGYSYKCYSDTKQFMKKYVNAEEGAIIYGISKSSQLMDQKVYRQLRKKYAGWDRQENLEFDARVAGRFESPYSL